MTESFLTVRETAHDEIVIQKSRFIGFAFPCASEEEAQDHLKKLKDEYRDATHHCYAYLIGANKGIMRYSDDGEPGGTAGLPIMNVLLAKNIVNCCIVVVRYFGGTKLGTGGLSRAYTQGCQIALRAAGLVRMEKTLVRDCRIPYSSWDSFLHLLPKIPARIGAVEYGTDISFRLYIRLRDSEAVMETVQKAAVRTVRVVAEDERYEPWEADQDIPDDSAFQ